MTTGNAERADQGASHARNETPKVLFLDQNKWIDLARASVAPEANKEHRSVLEFLVAKVECGELLIPLTAANIFETERTKNVKQRFDLAYTQVLLSGARVFRGYYRQLEVEVAAILAKRYGLPASEPEPLWFLSDIFFESQAEASDPRFQLASFPNAVKFVGKRPQQALFEYLMGTREITREVALRQYAEGAEQLRAAIEERRQRDKTESLALRRRIYSAVTAINIQPKLIEIVESLGLPVHCLADSSGAALRAVIRETPAFHIEVELALKLEALSRPITSHDMCDMRSFCSVLPYADIVVAENLFTNLARQAGFQGEYSVKLETDICALPALLQ
jgi:hypothetical protein